MFSLPFVNLHLHSKKQVKTSQVGSNLTSSPKLWMARCRSGSCMSCLITKVFMGAFESHTYHHPCRRSNPVDLEVLGCWITWISTRKWRCLQDSIFNSPMYQQEINRGFTPEILFFAGSHGIQHLKQLECLGEHSIVQFHQVPLPLQLHSQNSWQNLA